MCAVRFVSLMIVYKMKSSIIEIEGEVFPNYFNRALLILIQKPQVINRKLSCAVNKLFVKIKGKREEFLEKCSIEELKKCENFKELLIEKEVNFEDADLDDLRHNEESGEVYVSVDKFLPRKANIYDDCYVLTVLGN